MNISSIFRAKSRIFYLLLVALSLISSFSSMGILMLINRALSAKPLFTTPAGNCLAFISLILISFLARFFFQNRIVIMTSDIVFDLEIGIVKKVTSTSFKSFERLGREKLYAALNDSKVLARAPEILVSTTNSLVCIICSICYLFSMSVYGGGIILLIMVSLFLIYHERNKKIRKDLNEVRDYQNSYYSSINDLIGGFKQVKVSARVKHNLFHNFISTNRTKSRMLSVKVSKRNIANNLTGYYGWYLLLGIIVFVMPTVFHMKIAQIATYMSTVLFMMSPLFDLINVLPFYTTVRIAVERINEIEEVLEEDDALDNNASYSSPGFDSIRFEDISFRYETQDGSDFPVTVEKLSIRKGEILFIVGANGSGKSTFINLLTGLYKPQKGHVFINDKEVSFSEFSLYTDQMAVIFSDQVLFKYNYLGLDFLQDNNQFEYLKSLINLDGVLNVDKEKNWLNTRLSKGQQKRVALLLALLENKPILILDEWAAEQDPVNREHFYTKWLETIRNQGRTVIAVTHDQSFFHLADRVIRFDGGRVFSHFSHIENEVES